ncbi:3-phosphoshikimate 1-carboxyvinyltransferase [Paenibacillus whitsoniae]|uniref:3-phosphoshikimate 1-carboxyvinyltransferase n=1 Tax=Paenibacillus whitsoniae TaxID=2496558 RepID=A0A3S0BIL2_9BACL|nr:3-phosphoshikimate 1-carboxyvinyltransferase [Paenibacillus whitsoniae]RTE06461.1 3-phosphoshikimate 1-carboxyvinyltransferase [Paenibacillus whitsoniae]
MSLHQPDLEARSPWSPNRHIHEVAVYPPQGRVNATLRMPGSKSLTNRALIIAALAEGRSELKGILKSDDAYWCIDALTKLGISVEVEGDTAYVDGCGGQWPIPTGELYVGAAGTVARFLPGALATGLGSWTLRGSRRMQERPMAPLLQALASQGASLTYTDKDACLPFKLEAQGLRGGEVTLPGSTSSQFISGVLLAAPYAQTPLTVTIDGEVVQRDYIQLTLDMMKAFGIAVQSASDGQSFAVPQGQYGAQSIELESDVSTCGYFWAAAALTAGRVRIEGVDAAMTRQPDIELLDVLEQMGCTVQRGDGFVEVHGTAQLKGGFTRSMRKSSDQTLTVAALAVFADAPVTLTGAAHIRHHECDRIAAICTELRKLGIQVDEHPDGLTVYPGAPSPALLDSYDDHRMAMALSLIGLRAGGIRITDPGCVSKTCPDYWARLGAIGAQISEA